MSQHTMRTSDTILGVDTMLVVEFTYFPGDSDAGIQADIELEKVLARRFVPASYNAAGEYVGRSMEALDLDLLPWLDSERVDALLEQAWKWLRMSPEEWITDFLAA